MGGLSSKKKEVPETQPLLRVTQPEKKDPPSEKKDPPSEKKDPPSEKKESRKRSDSYPPRTVLRCFLPPEQCPHCQLEFALTFACNRIAEAEKDGLTYSNLSIFNRASHWLRVEMIKKFEAAGYKVYQDHYKLPEHLKSQVNLNSPLLMVVWDK